MISLKQSILLASLAGGMAFVWIPELRQMLPSFLSGGEQASVSPATKNVGIRTETVPGSEPDNLVRPNGDGSKPAAALLSGSPDRWASVLRNFQPEKPAVVVVTSSDTQGEPKTSAEGSSLAGWQNQLQSMPLTGILVHPLGNRAMFGGQSYHVGQELLPGLAIASIQPQVVLLSDGKREITVALPPMGAKPAKGASPFQIQTNSPLPLENQ